MDYQVPRRRFRSGPGRSRPASWSTSRRRRPERRGWLKPWAREGLRVDRTARRPEGPWAFASTTWAQRQGAGAPAAAVWTSVNPRRGSDSVGRGPRAVRRGEAPGSDKPRSVNQPRPECRQRHDAVRQPGSPRPAGPDRAADAAGADLAPPHPGHEEEPRDHGVEAAALEGDLLRLDADGWWRVARPAASSAAPNGRPRFRSPRRSAGSQPGLGPVRSPAGLGSPAGPGSTPRPPPSRRLPAPGPGRGAPRGRRPRSCP